MTETKYYQQETDIWHQLIDKEKAYLQTRQNFLNCSSKVEMLRKALQNPSERVTALEILDYLASEERQSLFDDLIKLASVGHSDIELVRNAILSLDKSWLLEHIENQAESVLINATDEEYRRLLELYMQIDDGLTQRLIEKALRHSDLDIKEVGEDFDNYLQTKI
jgi:hypothetical protein